MKNNNSEIFFAELCQFTYLSGFTFHSPKIYDPTEKEIGDIIIWVRTQLFVFELIWRSKNTGNTKSFIKRIGEKRDQLSKDYEIFKNHKDILMTNRGGRTIKYEPEYFVPQNFSGIIIIDCEQRIEKIHFGTLNKILESQFPIVVITKKDFQYILREVDTSSDLKFYLRDRFEFFKKVFSKYADIFLDLNEPREKQLIAYYKLNSYTFPIETWNPAYDYWSEFQVKYAKNIEKRDKENENSKIIDGLINTIMECHSNELPLVHAWQLAVIPRRARASVLTQKITDALNKMHKGKPQRHFALLNPMTHCWLVFYFQYGEDKEFLIKKIERLTRLKLIYEISENNFSHSVIGYGFRKSKVVTKYLVDDIVLVVEDAKDYKDISNELLTEAKQFFGGITSVQRFKELPST